MNHNNAKERAECRPLTPFQVQSKHIDAVSDCIVFAELTLTVGNQGELNLYRQASNGELEHQATCRVFDCPVVAYDLLEEDNNWKIVFVAFDNRIAAITIQEKRSIIITHLFQFPKAEELSSCIWGRLPNQLILGSRKGNILLLNLDSTQVIQSYKLQERQVKLLRCGRDQVYLSTRNDISKLVFQQQLQSIVILCETFLGFRLEIQDFAISQKQLYNFLVILGKQTVYFFHLANLTLPPQEFSLSQKSQGQRLGWGRDYNQLAVYSPLRKGAAVEVFDCNVSGIWGKRKQ